MEGDGVSLTEKPHRVTIELPDTEQTPSGYEAAPHKTAEVSLDVQITPKSVAFGLENYGVELARPYKLMAENSDEPFLIHGAKVRWMAGGRERVFYIKSPVRFHAQGDDCDHVSVMIEEDFGG